MLVISPVGWIHELNLGLQMGVGISQTGKQQQKHKQNNKKLQALSTTSTEKALHTQDSNTKYFAMVKIFFHPVNPKDT